jgi:hypothetical protein
MGKPQTRLCKNLKPIVKPTQPDATAESPAANWEAGQTATTKSSMHSNILPDPVYQKLITTPPPTLALHTAN